ncbi:MAG: type III pantothenate kinase [Candidatus Borkfalkiaceae bacterium]|nr:type III pantothenate kinase [Christensenellaceae bacterium]
MLLTIDIGNTNIKYGIYKGKELVASFRVSSRISRTADEYGSVLVNLLDDRGIKKADVDGIIISSVIPPLNYTICHMCEYFFGITPLMVGPGIKTGLNVKTDNPKEVGADIIVNSVSAFGKYGGPTVVIDFGTATTFDIIDENCSLLGVVIAPGIKTSLEGLVNNTAQLPMIELDAPESVIGKNTKSSMQAGIIFGFAGLVDNIINKIKRKLNKTDLTVVATGGLGEIIAKEVKSITKVDRTLTLDGLRSIYDLNKENV